MNRVSAGPLTTWWVMTSVTNSPQATVTIHCGQLSLKSRKKMKMSGKKTYLQKITNDCFVCVQIDSIFSSWINLILNVLYLYKITYYVC